MKPVAVVGAGVIAPWGTGWRGASRRALEARPSVRLACSHPETRGYEVPPASPALDAVDARQRKLMSRTSVFAAIAMREALADAGWTGERDEIGCFLGVGASDAALDDIPAALEASLVDGVFSEAAFGARGVHACHPLFVFQFMNNFTLCHGAILEGLGGPNGAFFSRGRGTVTALREALAAIDEGACDRALAGGSDSAHHPVTWAELRREGLAATASEGAALLALSGAATRGLAWITSAGDLCEAGDVALAIVFGCNASVTRDLLLEARRRWPGAAIEAGDHGLALAAAPALAWAVGLDRLDRGAESVAVLTAGPGEEPACVCLSGAR